MPSPVQPDSEPGIERGASWAPLLAAPRTGCKPPFQQYAGQHGIAHQGVSHFPADARHKHAGQSLMRRGPGLASSHDYRSLRTMPTLTERELGTAQASSAM